MQKIIILGANGQIALVTTRLFLERTDTSLTLYLRNSKRLSNIGYEDRVRIIDGDVLDEDIRRRSLAGSLIGGIEETQEMLDFCKKHNIVSDIEMINMQDINQAYDHTIKGDVKYRFVIDMASLKNA